MVLDMGKGEKYEYKLDVIKGRQTLTVRHYALIKRLPDSNIFVLLKGFQEYSMARFAHLVILGHRKSPDLSGLICVEKTCSLSLNREEDTNI